MCRLLPAVAGAGAAAALGGGFLRRVVVEGQSMRPTFDEGDRLLCGPAWRLRPGDVVVVAEPGAEGLLAVKRVAAVRPGEVVVVGDNAAASLDSRAYGPLPRSSVVGRVWWRYHPEERSGRPPGGLVGPPAGGAMEPGAGRPPSPA